MKTTQELLKEIKDKVPWNTYSTIKGQIEHGKSAQARVGIERIIRRLERKGAEV